MKRIITAIGNEKLNNILKEQKEIVIESPDIQYQEGIFEALEKYKDIDMAIINDDIIGNLELEDLIRSIIILKNDIEIILITEKKDSLIETKNILKVINNKNNYVDKVLEYLLADVDINYKKVTNIEFKRITKEEERVNEKHIEIRIDTNNEPKIKSISQERKKQDSRRTMNREAGKYRKENENNIITVIGASGIRQNNFYINTCKTCKNKKDINYRF